MGVRFLGFNIHESSLDYINPQKFIEITSWVAGVSFVGEIYKPIAQDIFQHNCLSRYVLDFLETDDDELIPMLEKTNIPLILKLPLEKLFVLPFSPAINYVIIAEHNGDEQAIKQYLKQSPYKILLSENFSEPIITEYVEKNEYQVSVSTVGTKKK